MTTRSQKRAAVIEKYAKRRRPTRLREGTGRPPYFATYGRGREPAETAPVLPTARLADGFVEGDYSED